MLLKILIVLFLLSIAIGIVWWLYSRTPAYQWKRSIESQRNALLSESKAIQKQIDAVAKQQAQRKEDYFHRQIQGLSLNALIAYHGIGPGIVQMLRDAGYYNVAEAVNRNFEGIRGIGLEKNRLIREAVQKAIAEARSRFDAAASPEGQEFRRSLNSEEFAQERRDREVAAEKLSLLSRQVEAYRGHHERAVQVSLWKFICGQAHAVPGEWFDRPIPIVEPIVVPPPPPTPVPVPPRVSPLPKTPTIAKPSSSPPVVVPPPTPPPVVHKPEPPTDIFMSTPSAPAPENLPAQVNPQLEQLRALCRFGYIVAKSDGRIAQVEKKFIREILAERFGHDPKLARHIDPTMEQVERSIPTEGECIADVMKQFPAAEYPRLVRSAENIADASGSERNPRERDLLARIRREFQLPEETVVEVTASPVVVTSPSSPAIVETPMEVLEITPGTELSAELIRRKYYMLTDRLDPSKAAGLGDQFTKMAEQKRIEVRFAAESLIKQFGEPLEVEKPKPPSDSRHNPDLDDVFGM